MMLNVLRLCSTPSDIAEAPMGKSGRAGGEGLRCMYGRARACWRDSYAQKHRGRGNAICHADSSVDHLRKESDGDEEKELVSTFGTSAAFVRCERVGVGQQGWRRIDDGLVPVL